MAWTPCEEKNMIPDENGNWYSCPFYSDPTGEQCAQCEYEYSRDDTETAEEYFENLFNAMEDEQ